MTKLREESLDKAVGFVKATDPRCADLGPNREHHETAAVNIWGQNVDIDAQLADLLDILVNKAGFYTTVSCQGGGRQPDGSVQPAYIGFWSRELGGAAFQSLLDENGLWNDESRPVTYYPLASDSPPTPMPPDGLSIAIHVSMIMFKNSDIRSITERAGECWQ